MDVVVPSPFVPLSSPGRDLARPEARPRCAVPHVYTRSFGRVLLVVCWYGDAGRMSWRDTLTGATLGGGPIERV